MIHQWKFLPLGYVMTGYSLYINFHSEMGECADGPTHTHIHTHTHTHTYTHTHDEHGFRL